MSIDFHKYAQEGESFLNAFSRELGIPENKNKAGRILRSVLHALRSCLTPEENIQLLSQLPMFLKAIYIDGWSMKKTKRTKHSRDIIFQVKKADGKNAPFDFANTEEIERSITVLFHLLRKYVSLGEMEDLKAITPREMKYLFNSELMV